MEVFLRNLPPHLTGDGLRTQLRPFMDQLSITDYATEKQRSKTTGHVIFLQKADARLFLMGKHVFCKASDREPDEFALKSIKHQTSQQTTHEPTAEQTKTLEATELSCGYHAFKDGHRLTFTAEWTASERCLVKFARRSVLITLTERNVQLRIPFQSIIELVWWHDGSVALTLSWAPVILASQNSGDDNLTAAFNSLSVGSTSNQKRPDQRLRLEAIDHDHRKVSAFCLVYHFKVPSAITRHTHSDFQSEMSRMAQKDLFPMTRYHLGFQHAFAAGTRINVALAELWGHLAQYNGAGTLPFGLLFLLQALAANSYLHPTTVSTLAHKLAQLFAQAKTAGNTQPPVSVDAFKKLFEWIDYPSPHGEPGMFEVDGIMDLLDEAERVVRESAGLRSNLLVEQPRAQVFRAVVTPTRVSLHGPELEPMNRVLRKYPDHSYFIRAQFCDENGQDLFFSPKISLDVVYNRFKAVLTNGIQVAGRVYKLLGFSHSSLRAHSAWLSAPFIHQGQLQVPDLIITGLGDFNKIQSPAHRAARIGQAFSETPFAVDLDEHKVEVLTIPDVERNGRVFSDGVGTISLGAADAVYKVIPASKGFPTAFQIRWGGAKGMLSLDPRLEGNKICIRPSMLKFESNDKQLEICDMASKSVPMVLNQQLIKILEDMGAPRDWFLDLQSREVQRLRGITATVYNTASFLRAQKIGEGMQLHKFLRQTEAMGIDYRRDNFLRGVVEVVLLRELRLLKHKARIPVRKGMTLFGIMDETGYLQEGEVYVTYDKEDRHCEPPGPGPVIVTRSPALHPGDVQVALNTVPPDGHPLTQHRNCLVFSRWGRRDLPSQLSGGDLDGDLYHVIWDPEVVGSLSTFLPADYDRIPPLELDRPVTSEDMAAFFVDFMKTDHLGVIATRHKILADQREHGTLDPSCVKLAELHSSAVDFSKTGRAVELSQLPRNPKWRPDFLASGPAITIRDKSAIALDKFIATPDNEDEDDGEDGPRHQFYASEKILGELFRAIDEQNIWHDSRIPVVTGGPSFWDQLLTAVKARVSAIGPVEWLHRSEEAHRIRHAYEDALHGVMIDFAEHPHQPLRELEVFVGFIMDKTGVQSHRQRDRSVKLKDEFERIATWITREMRNPSSINGHTSELDVLELCLACLYAGCEKGYREIRPGHRSSSRDLESFKIVAAAALVRELSLLERGMAGQAYAYGGEYVGVSGRPTRNVD